MTIVVFRVLSYLPPPPPPSLPPQHYDDKVDIWSIGALLYKVIVGECGFYAVS